MASKDKQEEVSPLDTLIVSTNYVLPRAIHAAIELDLFRIIAKEGPNAYVSASEIASQLPTRNTDAPAMLDRLLLLFSSHSLVYHSFRELPGGRVENLFSLTPMCGFFLAGDETKSGPLVPHACHPATVEVWMNMKDLILEGGDLFTKVKGVPIYEYANKDPEFNHLFNRAMVINANLAMNEILKVYNGFEGIATLVDVGGGTARTLNMIISKYPFIKGINFDLPHVVKDAPHFPGIENVGGDMFSSIPKGDAIIMKSVIHNWDDDSSIKILKNCYLALPKNGKLVMINDLLTEAPDLSKASQFLRRLDTIMLVEPGGKERTAKEYEALSKAAGFTSFRVACVAHGVWAVMESYK